MDQLLMMKDAERILGIAHNDQDLVLKKLEQLITLFYRAVDAQKNDDEVYIRILILSVMTCLELCAYSYNVSMFLK